MIPFSTFWFLAETLVWLGDAKYFPDFEDIKVILLLVLFGFF